MAKRRVPPAIHHDDDGAVLTVVGARYLLSVQLGIISLRVNSFLRLFTNNITPQESDVLSMYTECTLPGYHYVEMLPRNWTLNTAIREATYAYATATFTFTANGGGVTLYGYMLTNADGGVLLWAEAFPNPVPVPAMGGDIDVQVIWTDKGVR